MVTGTITDPTATTFAGPGLVTTLPLRGDLLGAAADGDAAALALTVHRLGLVLAPIADALGTTDRSAVGEAIRGTLGILRRSAPTTPLMVVTTAITELARVTAREPLTLPLDAPAPQRLVAGVCDLHGVSVAALAALLRVEQGEVRAALASGRASIGLPWEIQEPCPVGQLCTPDCSHLNRCGRCAVAFAERGLTRRRLAARGFDPRDPLLRAVAAAAWC